MPKEKVANLSGGLLDAAVALADGRRIRLGQRLYVSNPGGFDANEEGYAPSIAWEHGGPIIEREGIAIAPYEHGIGEPSMWVAWVEERQHQATFDSYFERGIFDDNSRGPTPLIAAMRAYCASVFGEFVEIP